MLNYMIVVDDAGELKSVTAAEIEAEYPNFKAYIEEALTKILDDRAIAAGEYDPAEYDIPFEVR